MNSPLDPALIQLVQQELKSLEDDVKNMSVECDEERTKVQSELQNCASVLDELQQRMERLEIDQQNMAHRAELTKKKMEGLETGQQNIEQLAGLTKNRVDELEGRVNVIEDEISIREGNKLDKLTFKQHQ